MSVVCLSNESDLDCHLQVVLLVLSLLLLVGFLCLTWRCCCIQALPESGQRRCGELGRQSFTIVPKQPKTKQPTSTLLDQAPGKSKQPMPAASQGQPAAGEVQAEMAPRPSQASSRQPALQRLVSAISQTRPAKVRVVWKLDLQHVQDWLAGRTSTPPMCVQEAQTQTEPTELIEPDADLEVASESSPQLPRQRSSTLVASQHVAKMKKETHFVAAYTSGDRVEYFSATQGKWLLGEVHVQPIRRKPQFVYSVTLYRLAQELPHVDQEMLRVPFLSGEPCELWSISEERWIEAQVLSMEAGSTPLRQYKVQCEGEDPLIVQASLLRRCFPEGSQVRVYQGAIQGFCHARVAGPSQPFREGEPGELSGKLARKDGPLDYNVMVPILKAPREKMTVPSFLLRMERQLLGTRASTADKKWKKTLAAKIGAKRP